jgi:putative transposase
MRTYRRYNYRAYPMQGQRESLSRLFGACRYVYNWVIDQRELMHVRHEVLRKMSTAHP